MTDSNITKIKIENGIAAVSFNVANLSTGNGLEEISLKINDLIKGQKPKYLIVDFDGVKFFSSQALGILIDARKKITSYGGVMAISGINPQLHRVFKITNLDRIFKFYPELTSAIESIKQQ